MRFAPGQTISHYRIIDRLGEGGMGIVYRAQDLKLPREVALKFLNDELVRNAEAKKRFVTEAKTASLLQHPNICAIFDIDEMEKAITAWKTKQPAAFEPLAPLERS